MWDFEVLSWPAITFIVPVVSLLRFTAMVRTLMGITYFAAVTTIVSVQLMLATQETRDTLVVAEKALDAIWRDGFRYQKAGIMLNDLCDKSGQIDLLDEWPPRVGSEKLMKVFDSIN